MTEPIGWQLTITAEAEVIPGDPAPGEPELERDDEQEGEQE